MTRAPRGAKLARGLASCVPRAYGLQTGDAMPTIIHHSELVRRALIHLDGERERCPEKDLEALLDEAGMRFNLTPAEAVALERLFRDPSRTAKATPPLENGAE